MIDFEQQAWELACATMKKAYAPYSKFQVGAALWCSSGELFAGCNVENSSYGATLCAERNALARAVGEEGQHQFQGVVVVTPTAQPTLPCGLCLQMLAEFVTAEFQISWGNTQGVQKRWRFADILPIHHQEISLKMQVSGR